MASEDTSLSSVSLVQKERLHLHQDPRGWICEPLKPEELNSQRNFHAVVSNPGAVRGNHYHQEGTEHLVVSGPALVRFREDSVVWDQDVPAGEIWRFVIPPGIAHAIRNTGDAPILLFGFNTKAHDPLKPDVKPYPLLEAK